MAKSVTGAGAAPRKVKMGSMTCLVEFTYMPVSASKATVVKILDVMEGAEEAYFFLPEEEKKRLPNKSGCSLTVEVKGDLTHSFVGVKRLRIGEGVEAIRLQNSMFPNVGEVAVDEGNKYFRPGKCLVYLPSPVYEPDTAFLLNTFRQEGIIDLSGISRIEEGAFRGCWPAGIKNAGSLVSCDRGAFWGSGLGATREGETVRMEGGIITAIDESADALEIPEGMLAAPDGIAARAKATSLTIHGIGSLTAARKASFRPPEVKRAVLDLEPGASPSTVAGSIRALSEGLEEVSLCGESRTLECHDGMLFSKGLKTLYFCPPRHKGDLNIPEGTVRVYSQAAAEVTAGRVVFPSSMREIGHGAFQNAHIDTIEFGDGLSSIGGHAFSYATIRDLRIPPTVTCIGESAFLCATIGDFQLAEGLEEIGGDAFTSWEYKGGKVNLPESLTYAGRGNFTAANTIEIAGDAQPFMLLSRINAGGDPKGARCVEIRNGSHAFAIPTVIKQAGERTADRVKALWNTGVWSEELEQGLKSLYAFAPTTELKQDIALANVALGFSDGALVSYLNRSASKMAERYIKEGNAGMLKKLLGSAGIQRERLEKLAGKATDPACKAYLMDAISKKETKKPLSL